MKNICVLISFFLLVVFEETTDAQTVTCPTPTAPSNGGTEQFGHILYYYCDSGYTLEGASSAYFCVSGVWRKYDFFESRNMTEVEPRCVRNTTCPILNSPNNGRAFIIANGKKGSQAFYLCDPGYSLDGSNYRNCTSPGVWSGADPTCVNNSCPILPALTNGGVLTQDGNATYFCDTGYSLEGLYIRNCTSGTWSGSAPTCVLCETLRDPDNGRVDIYSSQAAYSCDAGYDLVGTSTRVCRSGRWLGTAPSCVPVGSNTTCPRLSPPANGGVTQGSGSNTQASYRCNAGYTLVGSTRRVCRSGRWFGSAPTCVRCPSLLQPANGIVRISGPRAFYSCDAGYGLTGSSPRYCSAGNWSGIEPQCVSCPRLSQPANGRVRISGSRALYSCNAGYGLVGSSRRYCRAGNWSGSEPKCESCPTLPSPVNGRVTIFGSRARYSCNGGYSLVGATNRYCRAGNWSGTEPHCVSCPRLPSPPNGRVTITGSRARYSCNSGYSPLGATIRYCSAGNWTGTEPQCVSCPRLPSPPNGRVTITGSRALYYCFPGYRLVGSVLRYCSRGNWRGTSPQCVRRTTG